MSEINPNWIGTPIAEIIKQADLYVHMSPGGWWFESTKEGVGHRCFDENTPDDEIEAQLRDWLNITSIPTIRIFKASPVGDVPVKPVHILIEDEIPRPGVSIKDPLKDCDEMFWEQAQKLCDALYSALPQGIRWRLIPALMKKELNLYFGVDAIPLDAKLLNWLEDRRGTVELRYDDINLWTLEDDSNNWWEGFTIRECLMRASMENAGQYTVAATAKEFDPAQFPPDHNQDMWEAVPKHLREGLRAYFMEHRPTGGFLTALLENDLTLAVSRADPSSRACFFDICSYIYNCAPAPAWGDKEKVNRWLRPDCCNFHAHGGAATTPCLVE
jgi:hypothetical protein